MKNTDLRLSRELKNGNFVSATIIDDTHAFMHTINITRRGKAEMLTYAMTSLHTNQITVFLNKEAEDLIYKLSLSIHGQYKDGPAFDYDGWIRGKKWSIIKGKDIDGDQDETESA